MNAGAAGERIRRIEIGTRRLSNDALHGGVRSRYRGQGMDFDEIREYQPGDDVRAIDWNSTARSGRTFVKKYREERQLTVVFVVDVSESGTVGGSETKRDRAIEIAGVLALAALRSDHRVGVVAFTDDVELFVPPARGRGHVMRAIGRLAALAPRRRGTDLSRALRDVRERLRRRAVVVVLSDFMLGAAGVDACAPELRRLALHHDVVALRIGDPLDRELPNVGLLTVEDAETGEVMELDTGTERTRRALAAAVRAAEERIALLARKSRVDLLDLDTATPWLAPLAGFFRARGSRS